MKNNFVLKLAIRYFSSKKDNRLVSFISAFSLLGITIGVAALIVVMSVMEGFHIELTSNIIGLGGDITIKSRLDDNIPNYNELTKKISEIEGIKLVVPQINSKGLAVSHSDSAGVIVRAFDREGLQKKQGIIQKNHLGNIYEIEDDFNAAIGFQLAISLGLRVGDKFTLICPNTISTIIGNLPKMKRFKVSAIFESGMYDYDAATVIMSLKSAQKLYSFEENNVNVIEVHTQNPDIVQYYANLIDKAINYEQIADDGEISKEDTPWVKIEDDKFYSSQYFISTWLNSNAQFLNALKIERVAMYTILSLIILVAAFNIVSSLFMQVNEKNKDIAILRTMGASSRQIMMIFVLNGTFIGLIGTFLGVILGVSFAKNINNIKKFLESFTGLNLFDSAIYFLSHLPSVIRVQDVLYISLTAIFLSILAALYPAYKASKLDPAEALRHE